MPWTRARLEHDHVLLLCPVLSLWLYGRSTISMSHPPHAAPSTRVSTIGCPAGRPARPTTAAAAETELPRPRPPPRPPPRPRPPSPPRPLPPMEEAPLLLLVTGSTARVLLCCVAIHSAPRKRRCAEAGALPCGVADAAAATSAEKRSPGVEASTVTAAEARAESLLASSSSESYTSSASSAAGPRLSSSKRPRRGAAE